MVYDHKAVEKKWQEKWEKDKLYSPDVLNTKKKDRFYNLWMFPYPSAEGLHAGHAFASTGSDVIGRFMRMNGKTVFQPIGYDSFGIHSENYAIKIGESPKEVVKRTSKNYERQMRSLGHGYDWTRTVTTSDPDYYRWTQWLFLKMWEKGLAYRKKAEVNFCPSCKTVLADEQVMTPKQAGKEARSASGELIDYSLQPEGELRVCERCGTVVEKRDLDQWFFKITDYADRLLLGLEKIDWSKRVVLAQKEWIGKSEGMKIKFKIEDSDEEIEVFTTRPDTINSATFIAVAGDKDKFTGKFVTNPANNKKIPVWEAEYVLENYGTGAIMGVPAYDERDMAFAKKHKLEVVELPFEENSLGVKQTNYHLRDWLVSRQRYWGAPIPMIYCNSCALKGISSQGKTLKDGTLKGDKTLQGPSNDETGMQGWFPVEEKDLPVELPDIEDFKPEGNGRGPLANHEEFWKVKCPNCGNDARRETDVMDTFVDSSWYFLRYPSVNSEPSTVNRGNKKHSSQITVDRSLPWNPDISKVWLPVDLYFGGAEHSVLHLMYARFVWMVLVDQGYFGHSTQGGPASGWEEPFPKFFAHGLMIKDGAKMSKSRGNVVNPDQYIEKYGSDTLRLYVMFLGQMDGYPDFRDSGIEGMSRFLKRVHKLFYQNSNASSTLLRGPRSKNASASREAAVDSHSVLDSTSKMVIKMHQTIKGVTEDIKLFKYNTAIAKIMEFVNLLIDYSSQSTETQAVDRRLLTVLCQLLAPFAPHFAEEMWCTVLGSPSSVHISDWPEFDPKYLISDTVTYVIQVNGKLRGTLIVDSQQSTDKTKIIELAKEDEKVAQWLKDGKVRKEIFVPNKLVNFVTT